MEGGTVTTDRSDHGGKPLGMPGAGLAGSLGQSATALVHFCFHHLNLHMAGVGRGLGRSPARCSSDGHSELGIAFLLFHLL